MLGPAGRPVWAVFLEPIEAGGPYTISVTSDVGCEAELEDVLFGDVWLCSGQSNMQHILANVRTWHTSIVNGPI